MSDRRDRKPPFPGHDPEAFVAGVLGRTSGRACGRALEQLDALLDGDLTGMDRQLVQAHLQHCGGCRAVAVTLGWLGPLLPEMAEIDPGPDFAAGVLDRTTRARLPRSAPARPHGAAGLMDRIGRWWQEQILRPAFATEVAYVATVVLVLAVATPGSPLRGAGGRALDVVTAGPTALPVVGEALVGATAWLEGGAADLADAGRTGAAARRSHLDRSLDARAARSAPARSAAASHLATLVDHVGAGRLGEAGYELVAAARSGGEAWRAWWHEPADETQQSTPTR